LSTLKIREEGREEGRWEKHGEPVESCTIPR
jgi:hypothetical protein